ncbi:methyltransferase domain-containing protein [Pedobacter sp. UYP1]|uniref:class I SAM-dependent methyltransferase n=1 Tax=Pedobacter sp. UYP1 TaxID=1756396 RepID=UPI00339A136C
MNHNSIGRFSNHSEDYQKYRPGYPEAIVTYLEQNIGLDRSKLIADIGSGTGIFTELLLKKGYKVSAVEPNKEMRDRSDIFLKEYPNLKSINGKAENTGLATNSVDLITVAQSFHWFDPKQTRQEFKRIIKPGGHVLLIWNILQQKSQFLKVYQALKNNYSDKKPHVEKIDLLKIQQFFNQSEIVQQEIYHSRSLNEDELMGYFRSSSYSPIQGEAGYSDLAGSVKKIFTDHQQDGFVKLEYDAKLFFASFK